MNSLGASNVFMRSLATRRQHLATSAVLADVIALYRAAGFDLIVVETAGIGQATRRSSIWRTCRCTS
jgi:methylmalonyl-CoA mutase